MKQTVLPGTEEIMKETPKEAKKRIAAISITSLYEDLSDALGNNTEAILALIEVRRRHEQCVEAIIRLGGNTSNGGVS